MASLWTDDAAARAADGRNSAPWRAAGVSIDSRTLAPGDLFVAIAGPNADGHDHVGGAFAAGAAAAMVRADWPAPAGAGPLLRVADTLEGLRGLARAARDRASGSLLGVTGSVGKTGVKDALGRALAAGDASAFTSPGNFNNHWGLPLSLALLPPEARFGVFELGMNHAGEIADLTALLRPDLAVVTTVEATHLAHFRSEEAIADAKAEIFEGLPGAKGVAVLNRDNRHYARLRAAAEARRVGHIATFGTHPESEFRMLQWEAADAGPESAGTGPTAPASMDREAMDRESTAGGATGGGSTVWANLAGRRIAYRIGADGAHWALNSVCILAAVDALGADIVAAAEALAMVRAGAGRGARSRVAVSGGSFELIDESYNASPASMRAGLAVLGAARPAPGGRRIAVLGDMLELGCGAERMHRSLAENLERAEVDLVFAAGPQMTRLLDDLPAAMAAGCGPDSAAILDAVTAAVRPGDVVFVKGSLGSRMMPVAAALSALGAGRGAGSGAGRGTGCGTGRDIGRDAGRSNGWKG